MPHPQHPFQRSFPIIKRVGPDADLNPHDHDDYVDASLAILGDNMVTSGVFIESQQLQDKGIRQEFNQQRIYMDRRFEKIDERFDRMDQRFERADIRLEEMRARQLNSMCSRAHEPIHAIVKIEASDKAPYVVRLPNYFPKNVGQFWRLKSPGHGKFECIDGAFPHRHQPANMGTIEDKLIYLIRFYEIQGYEGWGTSYDAYTTEQSAHESSSTDDSSDLEKSTTSELALKDAVRRHPNNALRALAGYLGLVYRDVMRCMDEMEQHRQLGSLVRAKRPRGSEQSGQPEKRIREVATFSPPRHSSSFIRRLYMTLSEELRNNVDESQRSSSERVFWHDPDIVEARAKVMAAMMASVPVPELKAFAQEIDKMSRSERSARKQSAAEPSEVPTEPFSASSGPLLERRSSQASASSERRSSKGSYQ